MKNNPSFTKSMETSPNFKESFLKENIRWSILNKLYSNIDKKKEEKIPKKLHQVWLGGEIPKEYLELTEKWKENHPEWEYRLWVDSDIKEFGLDKNTVYNEITNLGSKSDVLRYHIINKYGGVYIDTDFISLKNLDELTKFSFFGGGFSIISEQNNDPEIYNGMFGSVKNNPILTDCINNFKSTKNNPSVHKTTGPSFFSEMIFKNINGEEQDIIFLPLSYFYPFPGRFRFNKTNINKWIKPESYCIHLWNCSWQKKRK